MAGVASTAGLWRSTTAWVLPTAAYDDWSRGGPPVTGWPTLLAAWYGLPRRAAPRVVESVDTQPRRSLTDPRAAARLLRRALLEAVAAPGRPPREGPRGTRTAYGCRVAGAGRVAMEDDAGRAMAGLVAGSPPARCGGHGRAHPPRACTRVGRGSGEPSALVAAGQGLLGEPTVSAMFQADLTVVVPGTRTRTDRPARRGGRPGVAGRRERCGGSPPGRSAGRWTPAMTPTNWPRRCAGPRSAGCCRSRWST